MTSVFRPERFSCGGLSDALVRLGLEETTWSETPPPPGVGSIYLADPLSRDQVFTAVRDPFASAVVVLFGGGANMAAVPTFHLPPDPSSAALDAALGAAAQVVEARSKASLLEARLVESEERVAALNRIGIALSAERDVEKLLETILTESRRFSGSEAGSLYLLEEGPEGPRLRFKLAQNDAVKFAFAERTVPVNDESLAGYVAHHGEALLLEDAYQLPPDAPYRHNHAFDVSTGWRTRGVLMVPMKDHQGELVGVIQLMNRRGEIPGTFQSYPPSLIPLLLSLATQAAICLKANHLTASIRKLFEDFARAAIVAVEQRDPTTAGHSNRVAGLSVTLSHIVDRAADGPYAGTKFSREEIHEIGTAALLHDFGKISVPERVLVKKAKLEPENLVRIRDRFDLALQAAEAVDTRKLLTKLMETGAAPIAEDLRLVDLERSARAEELEAQFEEIRRANEPTVLPRESGGKLRALLTRTWVDRRGVMSPLLHEEEFRLLSIAKGSLSSEERIQIQSHVSQTWRFLSTIPWTPDLARVPEIAHAHHEKLDGSGYPRGISGDQVPLPSRILTVCDIYDALTAADRPYKKAVQRESALKILEDEAAAGLLDRWLVQTFIEQKVWVSQADQA